MGKLNVRFLFSSQNCHISAVSDFTATFTLSGQAKDGRPGRWVGSVQQQESIQNCWAWPLKGLYPECHSQLYPEAAFECMLQEAAVHVSKKGCRGWLCLPLLAWPSRKALAMASRFSLCSWVSLLDWVHVSCWPNQCQLDWLQWFINHGKPGRNVKFTAPIRISFDLMSVYGRHKSWKTLSIFYEWNEYFKANMSCSAEVTYLYETPINFVKVSSTRTQQQATSNFHNNDLYFWDKQETYFGRSFICSYSLRFFFLLQSSPASNLGLVFAIPFTIW